MPITTRTVCIIGAGISGLASIKWCLEEGLNPSCFEVAADLGGIWNAEERILSDRSPKIYPSLITNVSKTNSAFSDFPMPKEWPPYVGAKKTLEYLHMYAEHFDLRRFITFQTEVVKVHQSSTYEETGSWLVETKNRLKGETEAKEYDTVIVASGKWTEQVRPDIPGLSDIFSGSVIHSGDFLGESGFEGKSVLVIGGGSSAVDVATECSRVAKNVLLSTRSSSWVVPRVFKNGLPIEISVTTRFSLMVMDLLPSWIINHTYTKVFNDRLSHDACGLKRKTGPYDLQSSIAVSDELPLKLYAGLIKSRPEIKCFSDQNEVTFEDGRKDHVDAVIMATGYNARFPFLSKDVFSDLSEVRLYHWIFPFLLKHPSTFAMVGLLPHGGGPIVPPVELQARFAASVLGGKHQLPSKAVMQKRWEASRERLLKSTGGVFLFKDRPFFYQEKLARELGVLPSFFRLLFTDPKLCFKVYFGPLVPSHYRLTGRHQWDLARKKALEINNDILSGMTPSYTNKNN